MNIETIIDNLERTIEQKRAVAAAWANSELMPNRISAKFLQASVEELERIRDDLIACLDHQVAKQD